MGFLVSHEGEELLYTTPLITLLCWHNSTKRGRGSIDQNSGFDKLSDRRYISLPKLVESESGQIYHKVKVKVAKSITNKQGSFH